MNGSTATVVGNPLLQLANDRAQARAQGDAMANLACLATAADGQAAARMLVLRDIDDELALFYSDTSPKSAQLRNGARPELLIYLPSLNVQYRLAVRLRALPAALLNLHWQRRPEAAKRIDWFYNTVSAQSLPIASRAALQQAVAKNAHSGATSLSQPPPAAGGYFLDVQAIERLHIQDTDPPHDRRRYIRIGSTAHAGHPAQQEWQEQVLVP